MNKECNTCDIVLELLPLYIEQKTGQESASFVKEHLDDCKECQEIYRYMSTDYTMQLKQALQEQAEAGQKKKNKKLSTRTKKVIILLVGFVGYLCLMAGSVIYIFCYLTGA
ncbi:MAG: zf-HC2 domain-containing protein [Lachnospiraceae bacterium]|nr:zf-HC2 domain-containing protein [Lachnospiraceae bacterium]